MYIDASALVALFTREPDWEIFADMIEGAPEPITGPVSIFETSLATARKLTVDAVAARVRIEAFLVETGVEILPLVPEEAAAAVLAHQRFGKGRHPASLNLGDCFSYAGARTRNLPLLFKGNDFALTDIRSAITP